MKHDDPKQRFVTSSLDDFHLVGEDGEPMPGLFDGKEDGEDDSLAANLSRSWTLSADDGERPDPEDAVAGASTAACALCRAARNALLTALAQSPKERALSVAAAWSAEWQPRLAEAFAQAGLAGSLSGMAALAGLLDADPAAGSRGWEESETADQLPLVREAAARLSSMGLLGLPAYLQAKEQAEAAGMVAAAGQTDLIAQRVRGALARAVETGSTLEQFRRDVAGGLGGTALSPSDSEQVFRSNVMAAYSDGQEALLSDPSVGDLFPFRAYHATHDSRTRPEHLAMEKAGIDSTNLYLASDPVWQVWRPPSGFNCRCTWTPVSVAEAARRGIRYAQDWKQFGRPGPMAPHVPMPPFKPDAEFLAQRGVSLSAAGEEREPDGDVVDALMRMIEGPTDGYELGGDWRPYRGPKGGKGWQRGDEPPVYGDRPGKSGKGAATDNAPKKDTPAADHAKVASEAIGKPVSPDDVKGLSGGGEGVSLTAGKNGGLRVSGRGDHHETNFVFMRDGDGGLVVQYGFVKVDDSRRNSTLAASVLGGQLTTMKKLGVRRIYTQAARGGPQGDLIGYKVWPKYGFDGAIPNHVAKELPEPLAGARTVQQLYAMPGGKKWWEENGASFHCSLDLQSPAASKALALVERLAGRNKPAEVAMSRADEGEDFDEQKEREELTAALAEGQGADDEDDGDE